MRKLITPLFCAGILCAGAYAVAPLYAAFELKYAIRSGDVETIRHRVVWDSVRESLRHSMTQRAPDVTGRRLAAFPTLQSWVERATKRWAPKVVDTMVDRYVTPEGFVSLAGWKDRLKGGKAPRDAGGIAVEMWERLRRLSFASLTRVEVIVADERDENKRIFGAMELVEGSWKLTEVRFFREGTDRNIPLLSGLALVGQ